MNNELSSLSKETLIRELIEARDAYAALTISYESAVTQYSDVAAALELLAENVASRDDQIEALRRQISKLSDQLWVKALLESEKPSVSTTVASGEVQVLPLPTVTETGPVSTSEVVSYKDRLNVYRVTVPQKYSLIGRIKSFDVVAENADDAIRCHPDHEWHWNDGHWELDDQHELTNRWPHSPYVLTAIFVEKALPWEKAGKVRTVHFVEDIYKEQT